MSVLDVDHNEPRRCLVNGLFEESVEVNGKIRTFYTYITRGLILPTDIMCSFMCWLAAPEAGVLTEMMPTT